jgi:hypothetical protein
MQTWMHAMKELDDRPLRELVIPGSHDAGTFVMEHRIDNNSSKCQEISILEQLKAGSRYLDLRAWKASDGEYWLYHGKAWTHVKLADALADIKTFLDQSTGEIVIATLLIDDKTNIDAGWQWACKQVKDYMATPSVVNGKSFADATLRQFRDARKRRVLLRSGAVSQLTCMDREGVWGNSLEPSDYVKALVITGSGATRCGSCILASHTRARSTTPCRPAPNGTPRNSCLVSRAKNPTSPG